MGTVLVMKFMKLTRWNLVILSALALNLASDLFWSMAITFFRGANLMARHAWLDTPFSFRFAPEISFVSRQSMPSFRLTVCNRANGVDVWTTGNDFDAQGARGTMLQRNHVIFSCYRILRTTRTLLHFRVSFISL